MNMNYFDLCLVGYGVIGCELGLDHYSTLWLKLKSDITTMAQRK